MKLSVQLTTRDIQKTLEFYESLGFEARDIIQEGDEIKSARLLYKDCDEVCIEFFESRRDKITICTLVVEEMPGEIPSHQKDRYTQPENKEVTDPNGNRLVFRIKSDS